MGKTTIEKILATKQAPIRRVVIALDAEWASQVAECQARIDELSKPSLGRAIAGTDAEVEAARDRLAALNEEADAKTVTFTFSAIGGAAYEALVREHQPTKAQREESKQALMRTGVPANRADILPHNPETFPPALIAACCVDPVMSTEEASELWSSSRFSQAERIKLFDAAQQVQVQPREIALGKAPNGSTPTLP